MIEGKNIYLTSVKRDDLELLMNWRNLEAFRMHFREHRELNSDMQNKWFESRVLNDEHTIMFSIHCKKTDKLVGCCGICYINWINRNGDISLYIGDNEAYLDERAEETLCLLLNYAFKKIGLHKVWSEVYALDNKRKQLVTKLNFHLDGVQREHYFYDGSWHDSYLYSIIADEYNKFETILKIEV